jgi:hypothetical protein
MADQRALFAAFRIVLLWNCVPVIAPAVRVLVVCARESGMTPAQVGNVVMWAYIAGTFGHCWRAARRPDRPNHVRRVLQHRGCRDHRAVPHQHRVRVLLAHRRSFSQLRIGATHVYASDCSNGLRDRLRLDTKNLFGRVTEVAIPTTAS